MTTVTLTKGALGKPLTENSELTFGKYKGKTVGEVCRIDPAYLVWLRDAKKDNRDYFAFPIHALLDAAILSSKALKRRFQPWSVTPDPEDVIGPVSNMSPPWAETPTGAAYSEAWGAF